ncbi:hypothetical protein BDV18DRAFT_147609 [Aspergillus unguis]
MSSDSGVQFIARRRKRPRQEQSATPHAQSSNSTPRPTLPTMPQRYAGDGFDFRRPVTSAVPVELEDEEPGVIDLTNEPDSPELPRRQIPGRSSSSRQASRPPRFGRDILDDGIDVVDLDDGENQDPPSSPEVQFVSSTVRQPPPPPRQNRMASNLWRMLPLPQSIFGASSSREIPWRDARHLPRPDLETLFIGDSAVDFTINLDNELRFMGLPNREPTERERPRAAYKPPSPAPEGFTRTVAEEDVVTCPNCDEELGTGDEQKEQIYAAKPCGHVYCGECAMNRSLTKSKKTNSKTKPFSKCQVPGCGKPVSAPKAMIQVFL